MRFRVLLAPTNGSDTATAGTPCPVEEGGAQSYVVADAATGPTFGGEAAGTSRVTRCVEGLSTA